jgi:hypothetical protein
LSKENFVEVHCPACQQIINIPEEYLGQALQCPLCTASFMAPAPVLAARPPATAAVAAPRPTAATPPPPTRPIVEPRPTAAEPVITRPTASRPATLDQWFALGALFGGVQRDISPGERLALFAGAAVFCVLVHLLVPFSLGEWIGFSSWTQTVAAVLGVAVIIGKVNSTHKGADNWSFVVAGLGMQIVSITICNIAASFHGEMDLEFVVTTWLGRMTANGQLPFFVCGLLFGGRCLVKGLFRTIPRFAYLQYLTFGIGIMVLSNPGISEGEVPYIGLLGWAALLVLNNWFLVEDFLVYTRQPIQTSYYIRICAYNLLLILFALLIGWRDQFGDLNSVVFYIVLAVCVLAWILTVAWLYRHGKPQFSAKVQTILDKILIDMFPRFLIREKR